MSSIFFGNPNPIYQPANRTIASISNSNPVIINTYIPHQYLTGLVVRINSAPGWGMEQINQMSGPITVLGANTFSMPIDSTNFDEFIFYMSNPPPQLPQVVPVGEVTPILYQATRNVLPFSAT
jgi:hypothetical protein